MKCGEITRALLGGFARLRLPASETDTERPREFDELPGVQGNPSSGWPPERLGDLEVTATIGDERSVGLLSNGRCPAVLMMRFPPDMPTRFSHLRAPTALPARNLPGDAATHVAAACHAPSCKIRSISEHTKTGLYHTPADRLSQCIGCHRSKIGPAARGEKVTVGLLVPKPRGLRHYSIDGRLRCHPASRRLINSIARRTGVLQQLKELPRLHRLSEKRRAQPNGLSLEHRIRKPRHHNGIGSDGPTPYQVKAIECLEANVGHQYIGR